MPEQSPKPFVFAASLQDFCVLLGIFTLVGQQLFNFADDPGVGWHLKSGEIIFNRREIPDVDPFLVWNTARTWVSDQWLSDLLFYVLYNNGGWPLLYGVLTVVYALTYFGVLYRGVSKVTGSYLASSLAVFLAFKLGELHFILRATMFGFLLFAFVYGVLYRWMKKLREDEHKALFSFAPFMCVPPVFALWANLHPSFVLGLLLLVLAPFGLALDAIFLRRRFSINTFVRFGILISFCLIATLLNPYGSALHESIVALSRSSYFMTLHEEWMPTQWNSTEGEIALIGIVLVLLGVILGGLSKLKWGFFEVLLLVVFGYLGASAVRMLPYFGIAMSVPLVFALINLQHAPLLNRISSLKSSLRYFKNIETRERNSGRGSLTLALLVLALIIDAAFYNNVLLFRGPFGPSASRFPYAALKVVNAQYEVASPVVVATPNWGGFISWYGRPGVHPVIDDRNTLIGEDFYKEFYEMMVPGPALVAYIESFGATHLLLQKHSPLQKEIEKDPRFTLMLRDEVSFLYRIEAPKK